MIDSAIIPTPGPQRANFTQYYIITLNTSVFLQDLKSLKVEWHSKICDVNVDYRLLTPQRQKYENIGDVTLTKPTR